MSSAIRANESGRPVPRFLAAAALLGVAAGVAFAATMLATDSHGMRSLLAAEQNPLSMTFLVTLVSAISFVPISVAAALGLTPANGARKARPYPGTAAAWSCAMARAGRTVRHDSERRHGRGRR